jgi:hypothetical protein
MRNYIKDSFGIGILIGFLSIALNYIVLTGVDRLIYRTTDMGHVLKAPRMQLIILAVNIFLFRFMMVKWEKVESARGVFLSVILVSGWYILTNKSVLF